MSTTNTPVSTPTMVSDAELKDIVTKTASEKLIKELTVGQAYFTETEILSMDRADLILHVCTLRKLARQSVSVKSIVSGFKPSTQTFTFGSGAATAGAAVGGPGKSDEGTDPIKTLLAFMVQQQTVRAEEERKLQIKKDQEKAERREEERKLQLKKDEEKENGEKKKGKERKKKGNFSLRKMKKRLKKLKKKRKELKKKDNVSLRKMKKMLKS